MFTVEADLSKSFRKLYPETTSFVFLFGETIITPNQLAVPDCISLPRTKRSKSTCSSDSSETVNGR
jgi:hypothetical protein